MGSISGVSFYGKNSEIATNRLDEQELSVLALHLLQICLVYVNTLMIQQVLAEPGWMKRMAPEDLRALIPLIWEHINPYGSFEEEVLLSRQEWESTGRFSAVPDVSGDETKTDYRLRYSGLRWSQDAIPDFNAATPQGGAE